MKHALNKLHKNANKLIKNYKNGKYISPEIYKDLKDKVDQFELYIFGEPLIAPLPPLILEVDAIAPPIVSLEDDEPSVWEILKIRIQDNIRYLLTVNNKFNPKT